MRAFFLLCLLAVASPALAQERGGRGYGREEGRGAYGRSMGPGYGRGGGWSPGGERGGEPRRGFEAPGYGPPGRGRGDAPSPYYYAPRGLGRGGYAPPQMQGFRRGQVLPPAYWGGLLPDPRVYRLRRPPNGYGWVVVGPNAYLMQRSTGLILDSAPLY